MPRLSTSLLRKARAIDRFLPPLLGPCRDLRAAQNELRWLREHADNAPGPKARDALLKQMVEDRATGKPLQYVLGTEYFGPLEIECKAGVLIPRQETAASVTHLVHMLRQSPQLPSEFRVLDLCTGTGCIPLLFRHELYAMRKDIDLRCIGIDISKTALELARRNLKRIDLDEENGKRGTIEFLEADVLIDEYSEHTMESLRAILNWQRKPRFWDVLISNPPYISPEDYWKTTTRSVRGFEPKLALVPPKVRGDMEVEEADVFYPRLLEIAQDSEAKVVLFEVADLNQAERVARMAQNLEIFDGIEIWRDQPDGTDNDTPNQPQLEFPVIGSGHGRSVVCWRGAGAFWKVWDR
ncbi:S-adenosyl-L-methionine-dependent methyltransferase [Dendryphion nanum]|uniref:S-adenosyl-L-methionine-dependent methyltransferase n=1 Tax=Dendryphion nanum TaxID=256645 RepID=A0A9P9DUP6_9PLEO|nr:S-adenosyl-L-methionine-dependent methyltransferase [Dendryphion nanum]